MANQLDAAEVLKQGNTRSFYQPGGPGTQRLFFGLDTEYHFIDSASIPTNGSIDPIYMPKPNVPNAFQLVGRQIGAPDLPTASLKFSESWGGIPRVLMAPLCEFNLYEVHSRCGDLSDIYRGWDSYLLIYSGMKFSGTVDLGTRTSMDSDELLTDTVEATGISIYPVGSLSFGDEATADIVVSVVDAVYGTAVQCAPCGNFNDGSQFIYALTRANVGSPSAPGQLVYSLDGGATWNTSLITGIGTTAEPRFVDIAGNILFVGTDLTTLFYTVLNEETGAPTTWFSVTLPTDMHDVYVQSPNNIWFTAATTIYYTPDITIAPAVRDSGAASSLRRITGINETIVAVGGSGIVRYTRNGGISWITATAPAAIQLNAVAIISAREWYVGGANGNIYFTRDRGNSWATTAFPGAGTGAITDILAPTREVIWASQNISSVAYLVTSLDGGWSWSNNVGATSRISNWPTFQTINRLAAPTLATNQVAANALTVAGLATGGADGILLTASAVLK